MSAGVVDTSERAPSLREIQAHAVLAQFAGQGNAWMTDPRACQAWGEAVAVLSGEPVEAVMLMEWPAAVKLAQAAVRHFEQRVERSNRAQEMAGLIREALQEQG